MAGNMPEVVKKKTFSFGGAGRSQLGLEWVVSRLSGSFCSSWQKPDRTKLLFDPPPPTLSSVSAIENGLFASRPFEAFTIQSLDKKFGSAGWKWKL